MKTYKIKFTSYIPVRVSAESPELAVKAAKERIELHSTEKIDLSTLESIETIA